MCEYCGCQALASIAQLTAEHEAVVNAIGCARRAIEAADVAGAVHHAREISRLLRPHTAVEEEALFPALARDFPEHVERLLHDHRVVEDVLAEAGPGTVGTEAAAAPGQAWLGRLGGALHLLREHILAEQDGAFPAALGALDPEDWDRVDEVRARVGSEIPAVAPAGWPAPRRSPPGHAM
jgi:hypothetical protein